MARETVGKISSELLQKAPDTRDPIELQREMHKDYEKNLIECVSETKKTISEDFYVVVTTKKERLMPNVLRNYFFSRRTCPRPFYDEAIYKYHASDDRIEFLWVVPSKDTCQLFRENALQIVPEEKALLSYIIDYYNGTLDARAKELNGEI